MTPEQIEFLKGLEKPPSDWGGMGATLLAPSIWDWPALSDRAVGEAFAAGVPDSVDLSGQVQEIRNQGPQPSCVAYSTCEVIDIDAFEGSRTWPPLLPAQLYAECGGTDSGIDSRVCLEQCRTTGAPSSDGSRVKIGSYLWVTQAPGAFRDQVKASIAAGKPVCVAMLLPMEFGWTSSGPPTSGYHQMAAVGYDPRWCIFANSWGRGFGSNGFCRVEWDYLEANNLQQRFVFAYLVTPAAPVPVPAPPTPTPPTPPPPPNPSFALQVLALVNAERQKVGAALLMEDARLERVALGHAQAMAAANLFEHDGPDGTAASRVNGAVPNLVTWGENIAAGSADPTRVVAEWMASPPHRANIVNPAFNVVGVGLAQAAGTQYGTYVTQDFGGLAPPPGPTPGPTPTPGPLPIPPPAPAQVVTVQGMGLTLTEGTGWVLVQGQHLLVSRS